jgi:hypothetical protein
LLCLLLVWMAHAPGVRAADDAFIRVVHGSPDAPPVDVYVNGKLIFQRIKFASVSEYLPVQVRSLQVQFVPQGATLAQGPIVISTTLNARAAKEYSVIAVGKVAKIAPIVLEDDNTIGDPTKAKVRFVHLSPDSPAVDIVASGQTELKLFANAAYKSVANYIEVAPAEYAFVIRPADTSVSKLDVRGLMLEASTVTTIYAFGLWSGTPKLAVGTSQDLRPNIILPETGGRFDNGRMIDRW